MKIAVVYNRESQRVINLFGIPNREHYGLKSIKRITDALKANGHSVMAKEAPIIFRERRMGKSKLNRKIVIEALWKIPLLRWKTSATTTPSPSSR